MRRESLVSEVGVKKQNVSVSRQVKKWDKLQTLQGYCLKNRTICDHIALVVDHWGFDEVFGGFYQSFCRNEVSHSYLQIDKQELEHRGWIPSSSCHGPKSTPIEANSGQLMEFAILESRTMLAVTASLAQYRLWHWLIDSMRMRWNSRNL